jgi:hypothetical protein
MAATALALLAEAAVSRAGFFLRYVLTIMPYLNSSRVKQPKPKPQQSL